MAREDRRGLRCRNSWRPADGPLSQRGEAMQGHQSPQRIVRSSTTPSPQLDSWQSTNYDQRLTPVTSRVTPEPPLRTFKNPNLMPVVPRRSHPIKTSSPAGGLQQNEEPEDERLPQVWHTSIDELIRRTSHDYDLTMNYERDAEGGQRWLPGDIAHIRDVGKNLHRDVFALRRWQRVVAEQGDQDKAMMMHIKREANLMKLLCERVQGTINKYEQKCEFELLRDGVYARDEDGNFYKPTVPQQFIAEGRYLQNATEPSTDDMGDDGLRHLHGHDQDAYRHHAMTTSIRKFQTPSDTGRSLPPKRNLVLDFAFQSISFDKLKREASRQESETGRQSTISRSGRVLDGRVSKPCQNLPGGRKRRSLSPSHRDRSPDSTQSARPMSDQKPRSRGRNNFYERNGVSRRQAKRDKARDRSPRPAVGRLGKHVLHY